MLFVVLLQMLERLTYMKMLLLIQKIPCPVLQLISSLKLASTHHVLVLLLITVFNSYTRKQRWTWAGLTNWLDWVGFGCVWSGWVCFLSVSIVGWPVGSGPIFVWKIDAISEVSTSATVT